MGCAASKLFKDNFNHEVLFSNGDYTNHVVSLTSSTYGLLKVDADPIKEPIGETKTPLFRVVRPKSEKKVLDEPEVINTWELLGDLEDQVCISTQAKKSPKSQVFLQKVAEMGTRNPSKFFDQINSTKKQKKLAGKENKHRQSNRLLPSPKQVLKPFNSLENMQKVVPTLKFPLKISLGLSPSRQNLSPLFDPELLASFEKELDEEREQIKKMVSSKPRSHDSMLALFEKKCPPGGDNAVVIYTTTLRGIRKTFENCNTVRSMIESHNVHMIERDISMDSGFREDLRVLMGKKEVTVPVVFVKGRLIGGADEVMKMEEEGKLGILLEGIPNAVAGCEGCAGVRFVMCMDCSGSCKVLDEEQKKMVKCGECNENGLIQCPICC